MGEGEFQVVGELAGLPGPVVWHGSGATVPGPVLWDTETPVSEQPRTRSAPVQTGCPANPPMKGHRTPPDRLQTVYVLL